VHSLFVDSTAGLVIGLLDSNYNWVEYMSLDEKKPSEIIHHEIYNLLTKYNLKLEDMQCFVSSGPGSYTGMRLSEGLAQIFELNNISVYSFYHFDVPRLSGVSKGFWATNAFKGQVFIFNWDADVSENYLINRENFQIEDEKYGYTLDLNDSFFSKLTSTKDLIKESAPVFFAQIKAQNLRKSPYYFRTLDEEFR
jgi:tRNA threonylcarbamoyladenosine biosynthesis protein TsaB